ncbi:MAG: alanine racemase [Myxococcota bacterium]
MALEPSGAAKRDSAAARTTAAAGGVRAVSASIDLAALAHNAREARRVSGGRELFGVVKADAYGHGAAPVARALVAAGCGQLAVLTVDEASALRDEGITTPILIMRGVWDAAEAREAAARELTPVVHDADGLARAAEAAPASRPLPIHVEVDTGMRRMGVDPRDALALLTRAAALPGVDLDGVFTHFARADEPDLAPSLEQVRRFRALLERARTQGIEPAWVHIANSAGVLNAGVLADELPQANAVRPGLMLYGVRPAPHLDAADLRPVMTLKARVAAIHRVAPGEAVGYGATFRAEAETRVATLALGYADGVPWTAAPEGRVWLGGALRPLAGRVSMDYTAVRIDDAPVAVGDEAVFFGVTEDGPLPVEDAARRAGTLAYELLVRVGARVPRRFEGAGGASRSD